ncbi:MAG: VTC domain-containing protein [Rikenellaceae bacterium]
MYSNHHRGKMNRYKIRRRNYISTQSSFLEVKFKSNKGRTVKVRQASDYHNLGFDIDDQNFIHENTPYMCDTLKRVMENGFRRLMLVSKAMNERCTIDSELRFACGEHKRQLDNLVIVEVKTDGRSQSAIIDALNRRRVKPSGFSKYCVGRSLTESSIKQNRFKRKQREIGKKLKGE